MQTVRFELLPEDLAAFRRWIEARPPLGTKLLDVALRVAAFLLWAAFAVALVVACMFLLLSILAELLGDKPEWGSILIFAVVLWLFGSLLWRLCRHPWFLSSWVELQVRLDIPASGRTDVVTLLPEGVQHDSDQASGLFNWRDVGRIEVTPAYLLIYTAPDRFILIPRRAFETPAACDDFISRATELRHKMVEIATGPDTRIQERAPSEASVIPRDENEITFTPQWSDYEALLNDSNPPAPDKAMGCGFVLFLTACWFGYMFVDTASAAGDLGPIKLTVTLVIVGTVFVGVLILLFLVVFGRMLSIRSARREFDKRAKTKAPETQHIRIDRHGIRTWAASNNSTRAWTLIQKINRGDDYAFFYLSASVEAESSAGITGIERQWRDTLILPRRAFPDSKAFYDFVERARQYHADTLEREKRQLEADAPIDTRIQTKENRFKGPL